MGKMNAKRKSILWIVLVVLLVLPVIAACAFDYLPLEEGSLPYAVLGRINEILDGYAGFFHTEGLSQYGLAPLAGFSVIVLVTTFLGAGPVSFMLKCIAFYSVYLIFAYAQGGQGFAVVGYLPQYYYMFACAVLLLSCVLLAAGVISRRRRRRGDGPSDVKSKDGCKPTESASDALSIEDGQPSQILEKAAVDSTEDSQAGAAEEQPKAKEVHPSPKEDPSGSRKALQSLSHVSVPEFESFPNYGVGSSVSSVDRTIYDVTEREARLRKEEQERKLAEAQRLKAIEEEKLKARALAEENSRREAEENRRRLEAMFKPRNLMKRLSEEAQAEKDFNSHVSNAADIDFNAPQRAAERMAERVGSTSQDQARNQSVQFQAPPSQLQNPFVQQVQFIEPQVSKTASNASYSNASYASGVAAASPSIQSRASEAQPRMPESRNATSEESVFSKEEQVYERRSGVDDVDVPASAVFKEEAIRAENDMARQMRRREEESAAREAQREVQRDALREAQRSALRQNDAKDGVKEIQKEIVENDEEIDAAKEKYLKENQQEDESRKPKGPDIDYVSGIAGLKSSAAGDSYLIDKQKFTYRFPPESMLRHYPTSGPVYEDLENDPEGMIIVDTLRQFRIETTLMGVQHGPTFTLYELALQKGVRVNSVLSLADNIAMELSVASVRILAPIPGKPAIGIEVPNKKRDTIGFDVMMPALKAKEYKIPMVLGRTITGESVVIDLAKTPHLLVAGTTGSGKSVCINGLICSVLFTKTPKQVRMLLVDPKMVELSVYNGIPHLLTPVITDPKKALKAMNFIVEEMERRMALFSSVGARKIEDYNEKIEANGLLRVKLPYIMVIIDEFADLMMVVGKELEASIKRITAVARFCGIHLVLATQRPSSEVITGIIKSNIPTQIAFAVSNALNSRIIIDAAGAEKLLGRGDMLYNSPEARVPERIQGAYIDSEIEEIVSFVKTQGQPDYIDESYFEDEDDDDEADDGATASSGSEDLFMRAWKIVSDRGEASASYIQRRLNIGYNRAANLIEQMEDAGYIGPARGSKPREVLRMYGSD